jgi:hypothetical protein
MKELKILKNQVEYYKVDRHHIKEFVLYARRIEEDNVPLITDFYHRVHAMKDFSLGFVVISR